MKRKIILGLTVLLLMAFSIPAFAAPWSMGMGHGSWAYSEPTAEQKAEIDKMNKLLFEERKQMIERRVEWCYLSRGEADSLISYMQEFMKNNPGVPLNGRGYGQGRGGGRGGCCGGWCW